MMTSNASDEKPNNGVLVSWIAYNNDPFHIVDGERIPGPTLCFLFDEASPYRGSVSDAVFFYKQSVDEEQRRNDKEPGILRQLRDVISDQAPQIDVHQRAWTSDDPTDYDALHHFLRRELPQLRRQFAGRPFYVHISPGTPAMQTMWVLMVETGLLEGPVQMVKTLRRGQRNGGLAAVPVELNLGTLFKTFQRSRPAEPISEDEQVFWDPTRFRSEKLKALYGEAKRLAQLKVPLLLLGERGTGKTTLASWIRLNSPYRKASLDEAWPSVACGQYQTETMRAELFGYRKGAYTGAERDKEGLLKRADGDTLFLDEIGDVSKDVQRLLIRALEEKSFFPLGAHAPEGSDFRLLAATNQPWRVLKEQLDADFLDRVSLFTLQLPALREIPEDVPWLWERVYAEARRRAGRPDLPSLPETQQQALVERLQAHPLPGNLRDLFRVAYRLIAATVEVDADVQPLPPEERVAFALDAGLRRPENRQEETARRVAEAFVQNEGLDALVSAEHPLATDEVRDGLQHFMGRELLRIAKSRRQPAASLCDKSERTLRNWTED